MNLTATSLHHAPHPQKQRTHSPATPPLRCPSPPPPDIASHMEQQEEEDKGHGLCHQRRRRQERHRMTRCAWHSTDFHYRTVPRLYSRALGESFTTDATSSPLPPVVTCDDALSHGWAAAAAAQEKRPAAICRCLAPLANTMSNESKRGHRATAQKSRTHRSATS